MHVLQVVEHVIALKTSFPQKCQFSNSALHNYSVITLGLLASTFKVLIGLPLVGMKEQDILKSSLVTIVRARTLSQSECPVRLRQMAWVQVIE